MTPQSKLNALLAADRLTAREWRGYSRTLATGRVSLTHVLTGLLGADRITLEEYGVLVA